MTDYDYYARFSLHLQAILVDDMGIRPDNAARVVEDVEARLRSLIAHRGSPLGDALLALGLQEAFHYKPYRIPVLVGQLVVMGVRNSLLEDLHAATPAVLPDRSMRLSDDDICWITKWSIRQLSSWLEMLPSSVPANDPFALLETRYPRATTVLATLQNATFRNMEVVPEGYEVELCLPNTPDADECRRLLEPRLENRVITTDTEMDFTDSHGTISMINPVFSGIADSFEHLASTILRQAVSESIPLAIPSFPRLSRNPEVVFRAIEVCLTADIPLVTPCFLITASRICYSGELPRPGHTTRENNAQVYQALQQWNEALKQWQQER